MSTTGAEDLPPVSARRGLPGVSGCASGAVDSHSLVACDALGVAVAFGGYQANARLSSRLLVYDPRRDVAGDSPWYDPEASGTAPSPRACHGSACIGTDVYVYGGRGADNRSLGDLHRLDLARRPPRWTAIQAGKVSSKGSYCLVARQGALWLLPSGKSSSLPYVDPRAATPAWTQFALEEKGPDLSSCAAAVVNDAIWSHSGGHLWCLEAGAARWVERVF
jgi:hypothetical protein